MGGIFRIGGWRLRFVTPIALFVAPNLTQIRTLRIADGPDPGSRSRVALVPERKVWGRIRGPIKGSERMRLPNSGLKFRHLDKT